MYLQKINLKNKYALVTGAGKGLGRACSIALAEAGATIIALSRTSTDLDKLENCLLYTSPSPRDGLLSRMPSSA